MFSSLQAWVLLALAAAILMILGLAAINAFGRVAQRRLGTPTLSLHLQPDQTALDRAIAPLRRGLLAWFIAWLPIESQFQAVT